MKLKLKKLETPKAYIKRKEAASGLDEDMRRYLLPPPEDFPLLKEHYDGEWFQRIGGYAVNQRWTDSDGIDHHRLIFYPAPALQHELNSMENDWRIRNDYLLLLWKMLQKYGIADYKRIPTDVQYNDFPKYLNSNTTKFKLKMKPMLKLKLKEAV